MSRSRALVSISAVAAVALVGTSVGLSQAAPRAHAAGSSWSTATSAAGGGGMSKLVKAAKAEGALNVIALPSNWANYGMEISTFEKKYGIKINSEAPSDSSAQEITAIQSSGGRSSAPDVVDVGQSYAVAGTSLFAPYKVATWKNIPAANKAANGDYYNDYGGYVSFGCDLNIVKTCPTTWAQLEQPQYKNDIALNGSPVSANAALSAVWAASLNNGGSLNDIGPGLTFFKTLESDGNFNSTDCNAASLIEAGSCPIVINWDYLNVAGAWGLPSTTKWKVVDPNGASFAAYYDQAVSKAAPHPAAARLWEEFLFSAAGQNIWLEGYARPVELQAMVKNGTVNKAAYAKLPKVQHVATAYPTTAQATAAGTAVSTGWTS
jgi:putative spermidine/putrescine transport system substrate-binding protein